ncbi:MAG: polysaccharide biosynthesis protein [Defluviitaleaceae bacterium]|nr:polysaccharide biosynthesis protein [Defluviitaleaceae bacterium]
MDNDEKNSLAESGFETDTEVATRGERSSSFVKQAAVLGGASLFVRLMGFVYRVPFTRLIGDEFNAFYGLSYQVYVVVLNLTSVFMITAISRLTSERIALGRFRDAHTLFKTAMIFSVCLGTVGSLVMFFGADILAHFLQSLEDTENASSAAYAIRAISPAVFIVSMLTVLRGYFQGMKTAFPTAISQVVEQIFKISFSLWLAFLFFDAANVSSSVHLSAAGATAGTAIAALAALVVVVIIYAMNAKALKTRVADDPTESREKRSTQLAAIIRTGLPIMVGLFVFSFIGLLDIRMANNRLAVSGAFSASEINVLVGQFTGKFVLLTTLPIALSMALSAAVIPEITAAHVTNDKKAVRQKTNLSLRLSMMLSFPATIGLAVLADPIIEMLFPLHPEGGRLLQYGAISIVFLAIVHVVTGVLQGVGRVKIPIIGVIIGVVVKIPLNHFLLAIPEINILGAVISTIACFAVAAAINLFFLRRFTGIFPDYKSTFLKPLLASAGMGVVCFVVYNLMRLFTSNLVSTLTTLMFAIFAYVGLMVLIKGFGERELEMLPIPGKVRRWLG